LGISKNRGVVAKVDFWELLIINGLAGIQEVCQGGQLLSTILLWFLCDVTA
jgi:hypothetical protein